MTYYISCFDSAALTSEDKNPNLRKLKNLIRKSIQFNIIYIYIFGFEK